MNEKFTKISICAVLLVLIVCGYTGVVYLLTDTQSTAEPTEVQTTDEPIKVQTIEPNIVPTTKPAEISIYDSYDRFSTRFITLYKSAQTQMPEIREYNLDDAKFLPDNDGKLWFAIKFTGSTDINSDVYLMGVVTELFTLVFSESHNNFERLPYGVMIIFSDNSSPKGWRCGAGITWSDIVAYANSNISIDNIGNYWRYPIIPPDDSDDGM